MAYVIKEYVKGDKVLIGSYENESDATNKVNELLDAGADGVSLEVTE
tara:strand:- start:1231 stop:1371 length:141 start_codon:yes stop_codon:yes gene_type:complete